MIDTDTLPWSIDEHLAAGSIAISKIELEVDSFVPQPVCHHFGETNPIDPVQVSQVATYCHLVPGFAALGVRFSPDRLEAWETVRPEKDWLHLRIPVIVEAANAGGLLYFGWTWEPRGRQPIGASELQVINNRSD